MSAATFAFLFVVHGANSQVVSFKPVALNSEIIAEVVGAGTFQTQAVGWLLGQQGPQQAGDEVEVQVELSKKPLNPTLITAGLNSRQVRSNARKTNGLRLDEGQNKESKELLAG